MKNNSPKLTFAGKSDIGLKRQNNEDASIARPELGFFSVADGMGGAAAGEIASRIYVDTALEVFSAPEEGSEEETFERVKRAFSLSNERILEHAEEHEARKGMACTAELIAFAHESFVVGHLGDSRTYRLRNGRLRRLTRDHSLVQDQIEHGLISEKEAKKNPYRNVILRAVGAEETVALDTIKGKIERNDVFLICTDGLTNMVNDSLIQEVLTLGIPLDQKAERLIDLAKEAGGEDNITVVLIEIL
jgi:serine/threonine protein phosphatase PrpC